MALESDQKTAESRKRLAEAELPPPESSLLNDPGAPYASSDEHLWDELCRIDQLVRAQTIRWWTTIAADKPENLWGMVHVTDAEVERYLRSPFLLPPRLPAALEQALADNWQTATTLSQNIARRLAQTSPTTKNSLRLQRLVDLFGLSGLHSAALLVCLLPEMDGRYRRLFGYLQDDVSRYCATVDLVLQILHPLVSDLDAGWAVFASDSPLLTHHLLLVGGSGRGDEPLPSQAVRLDSRIARYLLGDDKPDERLNGGVTWPSGLDWRDLVIDDDHLKRLTSLATWWQDCCQDITSGVTLLFHGPYGSGRLAAARAVCAELHIPLITVDVEWSLRAVGGWELIIDLAYREARLQRAAIFWSRCDRLLEWEQPTHLWEYLVATAERFNGLSFLASNTTWEPTGRFQNPGRPFLRLAFPMPDHTLRHALWKKHLPSADAFSAPPPDLETLAQMLANSFQLTEGQIIDARTSAYSQAIMRDPQHPRLMLDDLYEGCRRQTGQRLISMARLIEPHTQLTFDDLILPKSNKCQLNELRDRIKCRHQVYSALGFDRRLRLGKGLIALFTGSSGTGKTLAAELLAREQGVDLYKIDLSAVVSKYVGETEKNLNRVFAEAEDANAILFFDEADALFGKRGEVKEARDKWANMETNYLLQRVEEYTGVVILASNLRQNLDEAFMRRIHVIVEFPFPEAEARVRIWKGMFPSGVQRPADAEITALADQFRLSGGSIKNIVVDAAFRALAEGEAKHLSITMRHLIFATVREYQKLGKPITKGEFSPTYYAWVMEDALLA